MSRFFFVIFVVWLSSLWSKLPACVFLVTLTQPPASPSVCWNRSDFLFCSVLLLGAGWEKPHWGSFFFFNHWFYEVFKKEKKALSNASALPAILLCALLESRLSRTSDMEPRLHLTIEQKGRNKRRRRNTFTRIMSYIYERKKKVGILRG